MLSERCGGMSLVEGASVRHTRNSTRKCRGLDGAVCAFTVECFCGLGHSETAPSKAN